MKKKLNRKSLGEIVHRKLIIKASHFRYNIKWRKLH